MSKYLHEQQEWLIFWHDNNMKQYVHKQIIQASLTFHKMFNHNIYFTYIFKLNNQEIQLKEINVIVGLPKGFPISPPQIYLATSFTKPSLKDHRDILVELIGESWDWEVKLAHVLQKLPKFIAKLISLNGNTNAFQKIGEFHAQRYYHYSLVKELAQHDPFICFETQEEIIKMLIVSITCTHIIFYQPVIQPSFNEDNKLVIPRQNEINEMKILFIGDIQSLSEIIHDRRHKNQYTFHFTAFHLRKMEYVKHQWKKSLSIARSSRFMQSLVKQMSHFGVKITIQTAVKPNSTQELLLAEANRCEQKLKHYFNRNSLMELIDAYQRLVQYYSADGPPFQQIYVHKTMSLYSRADVQLILKAHSSK